MAAALRDLVVLMTGATGSIGAVVCRQLADQGATVVGLDVVAGPGTLGCDITDEAQVHDVVAHVLATHGKLDVLINSAGITATGEIGDHDLATHRRLLEVNHLGALSCTLAVLPALRASRGQVVTIGSVAGFAPVLGRPAYVASKHAVTGLMGALGPELAADGVTVTMVHPTFVSTPVTAATGSTIRSTTGEQVGPEEVASAILGAIRHRRERVLVGRTARVAWHVNRLAPRTYVRLMSSRLRRHHQTAGAV